MFFKKKQIFWGNAKGFTLIELIASLVIVGILTAVALTRSNINNHDLISIQSGLKAHIRFAQTKAMQTNETIWGIRIDSISDEYWLFSCPADQSCSFTDNRQIPPGTQNGPMAVGGNRLDTGLMQVDIRQIINAASKMTLVFDSYGVPYVHDATSITFNDPLEDTAGNGFARLTRTITIELADNRSNLVNITILPETGFIQ